MKCEQCKKIITGDYEVMGNKNYCPLCFPEVEETERQRIALVAYIIDAYGIKEPTGFMFGQIKRMKNQYTYKNMRLTLDYAFNVVGLKPNPKYGLSLIEYYHDDMINYYKSMIKKMKKNKGIIYNKEKIVKVKPKDNDYKKKKLLDMSQFNKEE